MTESDIRRAYVRMREVDQTIPDEVLDFMRDCALAEIKRMEEAHRQRRRDRLDEIKNEDYLDCFMTAKGVPLKRNNK